MNLANLSKNFFESLLYTNSALTSFSPSIAPLTINGNVIERYTDNDWVQTATKTLQSLNVATISFCIGMEIFFSTGLAFKENFSNGFFFIPPIIMLSIPLTLQLTKKAFSNHERQIGNFQDFYSKFLNVINIISAVSVIALAVFLSISQQEICLPLQFALSCISLFVSIYPRQPASNTA